MTGDKTSHHQAHTGVVAFPGEVGVCSLALSKGHLHLQAHPGNLNGLQFGDTMDLASPNILVHELWLNIRVL